jgi:hypothetical protein
MYYDDEFPLEDYQDFYEEYDDTDLQVGYNHMEQMRMATDPDLAVVTDSGYLTPEEKFKIEVQNMLEDRELGLSSSDINLIREKMKTLTFVQYRNPFAYVLGYYVYKDFPIVVPTQLNPTLKRKIDVINGYKVPLFLVIKYLNYWKTLMKL